MKITTHLITYNNEDVIDRSLKSVLSLNGEIVIGDLGSTDGTIKICQQYGAKMAKIKSTNDYSQIRNEIITKSRQPWQFYLEPGEVLATGHESIVTLVDPKIFTCQVFAENVVTKEVRLWHKSFQLKFIQPVYETLNNKTSEEFSGVIIYYHRQKDNSNKLAILERWLKSNPLDKEPYYYKAFTLLGQHNYKDFITIANEYLFHDKAGLSAVMMQYYVALVQLHLGNTQAAVRGTVGCIAANPLMAEFWCLLGDIYYKIKQYHRAILYYENAMILGKRRFQSDLWPIEILKYKKYPLKMIESCNNMTKGTVYKKI